MGLAQKIIERMTIEEYLEGEKSSQIKHELLDGVVHAMAGASDRHNRISGNIFTQFDAHLADDTCEPFIADMKVWVSPATFYYPDVLVACDDDPADPYYRKHPRIIVEVTSPSTEQIDRTEKLSAYKQLKSLKEYVIVSQDVIRIDVYRRMRSNRWEWELLSTLSEDLRLESVGLTLKLAQIYRRVKLPPPTPRPQV